MGSRNRQPREPIPEPRTGTANESDMEDDAMRKRAPLNGEEGQTVVEFAIVVPVLLLVVFAVVQLGIVFNNNVTLTDAVRSGARVATVSRLAADPASATVSQVQRAAVNLDSSKLAVTVSSGWLHGGDVTVTATYPYSVSVLGLVVKSGWLQSTTTARVE